MTTEQEKGAFAKMTTGELRAYQNVLNCSRGTIYIDPSSKLPRHRILVGKELASRV